MESNPERDRIIREQMTEAARQRREGVPAVVIRAQVEGNLVENGVEPEHAASIAQSLPDDKSSTRKKSDGYRRKQILWSFWLFILGVTLFILAYCNVGSAAHYIVASAPLIAGAILLFKGMIDPDEKSARLSKILFWALLPAACLVMISGTLKDALEGPENPLPEFKDVMNTVYTTEPLSGKNTFENLSQPVYEQFRKCMNNAAKLSQGLDGEITAEIRASGKDGKDLVIRINEFGIVTINGKPYETSRKQTDQLYAFVESLEK